MLCCLQGDDLSAHFLRRHGNLVLAGFLAMFFSLESPLGQLTGS
jgi:hypothetical protein